MLTESLVERTLTDLLHCVLPVASEVEYRLVGTSAMLLRGVNLPSRDIDLLFRERAGIDIFHKALMIAPAIKHFQPPTLLDGAGQYFARYEFSGSDAELSTVEFEVDTSIDTFECVGGGPWEHFDLCPVVLIKSLSLLLNYAY